MSLLQGSQIEAPLKSLPQMDPFLKKNPPLAELAIKVNGGTALCHPGAERAAKPVNRYRFGFLPQRKFRRSDHIGLGQALCHAHANRGVLVFLVSIGSQRHVRSE